MDEQGKQKFTDAYSVILGKVWGGDEEFKAKLLADPKAVCAEAGLDSGAAAINVVTDTGKEGTLDDQISLWEKGVESGSIDLYIPLAKPEDMADMDLSDEDLEAVAGGGDCCCCCTPCCSC